MCAYNWCVWMCAYCWCVWMFVLHEILIAWLICWYVYVGSMCTSIYKTLWCEAIKMQRLISMLFFYWAFTCGVLCELRLQFAKEMYTTIHVPWHTNIELKGRYVMLSCQTLKTQYSSVCSLDDYTAKLWNKGCDSVFKPSSNRYNFRATYHVHLSDYT